MEAALPLQLFSFCNKKLAHCLACTKVEIQDKIPTVNRKEPVPSRRTALQV